MLTLAYGNAPRARRIARAESLLLLFAMPAMTDTPFEPQPANANRLLRQAAAAGHCAGVENALFLGADANAADVSGNTALFIAILGGFEDISRRLLPLSDLRQANKAGETALMMAAQTRDAALAKKIAPKSDARAQDQNGRTALSIAILARAEPVVEILLRRSDLNLRNAADETLLMMAARSTPAIARLLVSAGADARCVGGRQKSTPLMVAAELASAEMLEALLPGSDANQRNAMGFTALDLLVRLHGFSPNGEACARILASRTALAPAGAPLDAGHGDDILTFLLASGRMEFFDLLCEFLPNADLPRAIALFGLPSRANRPDVVLSEGRLRARLESWELSCSIEPESASDPSATLSETARDARRL